MGMTNQKIGQPSDDQDQQGKEEFYGFQIPRGEKEENQAKPYTHDQGSDPPAKQEHPRAFECTGPFHRVILP
jgi:hypothetical protein